MTLGTQIAIASELGSYIVLMCLLGYFGGNWLDGLLKSSPYGVVAGLMVGMGVGLAIVVKRSDQLDKAKVKKSGMALPFSDSAENKEAPEHED